ncbi:MAG: rhodanese-like domain-containing protein [Solirubrobacteraceae bacterium]
MDGDYTARQVAQLHGENRIQLIDVRQPHEYEAGRIAGSRLVELAELPAQAETLDRNREIVFYCRSGARSAMATQAFRQAGYDAHNMVGGLLDWEAAGLPLEPEKGYVADS